MGSRCTLCEQPTRPGTRICVDCSNKRYLMKKRKKHKRTERELFKSRSIRTVSGGLPSN